MYDSLALRSRAASSLMRSWLAATCMLMNAVVSSACSVRSFELSATNTRPSRLATRCARSGAESATEMTNVSSRRISFVLATGSGTLMSMSSRNSPMARLTSWPEARCSSLTTRERMVSLLSCCDRTRSRSWLSNDDGWPTIVGETVGAATPSVVVDRYSLGRYFTSSQPATSDRAMGAASHLYRRRITET